MTWAVPSCLHTVHQITTKYLEYIQYVLIDVVDTQIFHLLFPTLVSVALTPASEVTVEDLSDVKAIFSCLSSHLLVTKHK